MKFAAHTMATPDRDVVQAAQLFRQVGFDGIDVILQEDYRCALRPNISDTEAARTGARIRELGLDVPCLVPYVDGFNSPSEIVRLRAIDNMRRALDIAAELRARFVRLLPGMSVVTEERTMSTTRLIRSLQVLADEAASRDIGLAVENHMNTAIDTASEMMALISNVDHSSVGVLYDPANLSIMGESNDRAAYDLQRGAIRHVHVNDYQKIEGGLKVDRHGFRQCLLGKGEGKLTDWISWLVRDGYCGFVTAEYGGRWFSDILPPAETGLVNELAALRSALSVAMDGAD